MTTPNNLNLSVARIIRVVRVVRAFRVLRLISDLQTLRLICAMIAGAFLSVFWALLFILIFTFAAAVR